MEKNVTVCARLRPDLWEHTGVLADKLGINRSDIINEALERLLSEKEQEVIEQEYLQLIK